MLVAITDIVASMHGDETQPLLGGLLERSVDVIRGYNWRPVRPEEHEERLAIANAGSVAAFPSPNPPQDSARNWIREERTLPRQIKQFGIARTYQCVASVLELNPDNHLRINPDSFS